MLPEELKLLFHPVFSRTAAQKVYLFGSHARGEADDASDVDLAIVAESQRPFVERFKDYFEVITACPVAIEILVYTPEEFEAMRERESPFVLRILEEGKIIYERSEPRSRPLAQPGRK